jgi:glycogen debranching enzyme
VFPHEVRRWYRDGTTVSLAPLEFSAGGDAHGLAVRVRTEHPADIALRPVFVAAASPEDGGRHPGIAVWPASGGRRVILSAGEAGAQSASGIVLRGVTSADFVLLILSSPGDPAGTVHSLRGVDSLRARRIERMDALLNASYLRTSDDTLTAAIQWFKLSLDALLVQRRDTLMASGLPWDGSFDLRSNAQSIAGIGLSTGDFALTGAMLRSIARYQETRRATPAAGRIADRIMGGRPTFAGADVGPWFVRELYEHVVASNDTQLVRELYPVIIRCLEGSYRSRTDKFNFLTHGPYETWMSGIPRGNRAVEVQLLWYFQQMIGSYVATYLRDTTRARRWWDASVATSDNFALAFGDTVRKTLGDFLTPDGRRDTVRRPNAVLSFEMLESEQMRFGVAREAVGSLMHPYGVVTRAGRGAEAPAYEGAAWTWLAGPVIYALTRYDRSDLAYPLTRFLARSALAADMAGTLPEMFAPAPSGRRASLTGMAEFLRTMYQDYLGLRVDLAARTLTVQPKLPDHLTNADFTVRAGTYPVTGRFSRTMDGERLELQADRLSSPLRVSFIWMMLNGDAWRGTTDLNAGIPLTIVFGADEATLFQGDRKIEIEGMRLLKKFSQRGAAKEFGG